MGSIRRNILLFLIFGIKTGKQMDFCLYFLFNDDNLSFFYLFPLSLIVFCIDCFKCVSMNGKNPECDDPFHNNFSSALLESPCKFVVCTFLVLMGPRIVK